jgi:cysteine desulfurase
VYLDHAATTPMTRTARDAYLRAAELSGNAASVHRAGQRARELLEEGRALVAHALGASPLELLANGGGTEGDNHVLLGLASVRAGGHVVTTEAEHSAVLAPARALRERGFDVTFLTPDRDGTVSPDALRSALRPDTFLVSVHHANNEIGAVQDVAALARVARAGGALFHTDAVQSPGVLDVDLHGWGVDFASFSAHKWGGPKGVGFLYVRRGLQLPPLLLGGGQEQGLRAGTHDVAGVYAAGVALAEAASARPETYAHLLGLRARMEEALRAVPDVTFNHAAHGSPKVVSVTASGADGEGLLMNLDLAGVYASAGSACSAGTMQPSHVLLALGLPERDARATIRFSFGRDTTEQDVDRGAEAFARAVAWSRV